MLLIVILVQSIIRPCPEILLHFPFFIIPSFPLSFLCSYLTNMEKLYEHNSGGGGVESAIAFLRRKWYLQLRVVDPSGIYLVHLYSQDIAKCLTPLIG